MAFTTFEWAYGIAQIATVFLSVVAGVIALSMFKKSANNGLLKAWRWLIVSLVFFSIVEIFGALRTFGIYESPFLTHVLTSVVLLSLIASVTIQLSINRGWYYD
ncbi:MAG: hypothetical protein Q7K43_03360 [Candidatus Woesearchaeota archaeon]|nr:hypothetical protein [Candidatus Woesearchaeota archaeon]